MYVIPEWPDYSPIWANDALVLLLGDKEEEIKAATLSCIEEKSNNFPIPFPVESVRCKTIKNVIGPELTEKYINSTYPVIHEVALLLCANFLLHKRKFGSNIEREFYKDLSLLSLIDRLLTKRAVVFINASDNYILLDGTRGFGRWEAIGTVAETEKLNLRKCLSYDEIKLSALLSVSSYTNFINDGNRYNNGIVGRSNVEEMGVIVGLIGARFEKPNVMEYQEVIVSVDQNDERNGYGTQFAPTQRSLISGFYGEIAFTYTQAEELRKVQRNRFVELRKGILFDNNVYCKRIALSIDTLLLEANHRAKETNVMAFVHVVGIGLGVWKISPHQTPLFLDTFGKRIQSLGTTLNMISDVYFAYFGPNPTVGDLKDGDVFPIAGHPNRGIKIYFGRREPHTKLSGEDKGKLLVVSYAWDANAYPGNEFWTDALSASGDPAAAASTQISELHNSRINPKVCAQNLRIATSNGLLPFFEYRQTAPRHQ